MNKKDNFNFLMQTVNMLSKSQGLYCRIKESILGMDEQDREDWINSLPDFKKDSLNVVFYFEC